MSLIRSMIEHRSLAVETPGKWRQGMVWQPWGNSATGGSVNTSEAMRLSAVWACLRLLTDAVSTLPLEVYVHVDEVRQPFRPRPTFLEFGGSHTTRVDYLTQVMLSLLTAGNAYVATPRDALGTPTGLIPLDPTMVTPRRRADRSQEVVYDMGSGTYDTTEIMHIPAMRMPGCIEGLNPIAYARESIDLGLAAQRFGAAFFANGALPGAVIQTPGDMSDEAIKRFRETWYDRHGGVGNAQRVGVLTEGATLEQISIAPDDAQFLETRQFQVPDIARIYGVPPHLIADASNSTSWGSGLAEQNLAFGQFSLRPWLTRIEAAHDRLIATAGHPEAFVRLNLDALLRASTKDRYEAHKVGLDAGFLTIPEVRATEDLPPLTSPPGGEQ